MKAKAVVILIDNYDSFTWNLVHYLGEIGAETVVHRNDKVSVGQVLSSRPQAIVLSPGPCTPNEAGICLDLIAAASLDDTGPGRLPRPPGHRAGLRRQGRQGAEGHARQDVGDRS